MIVNSEVGRLYVVQFKKVELSLKFMVESDDEDPGVVLRTKEVIVFPLSYAYIISIWPLIPLKKQ